MLVTPLQRLSLLRRYAYSSPNHERLGFSVAYRWPDYLGRALHPGLAQSCPCITSSLLQAIENKRTRELSEEELTNLREEVDKYTVEGDLRRFNALNIKRLRDIGCYRGRRHAVVSFAVVCATCPA